MEVKLQYRHPIQESHDFVLQNHVFVGILPFTHIPDRANFLITQIERHEKYFEQKSAVVLDS